jgi:hypothetical protein
MGIGPSVVDDEPGIDRDGAGVLGRDIVGVRVSPQSGLGLVEGDVVSPLEEVRSGQAGNATADDSDTRPL